MHYAATQGCHNIAGLTRSEVKSLKCFNLVLIYFCELILMDIKSKGDPALLATPFPIKPNCC